MTPDLKQAAADYLLMAFKKPTVHTAAIQAAAAIALSPDAGTPPVQPPGPPQPPDHPQPPAPPQPTPTPQLPADYSTDPDVGFRMLKDAMSARGLTPLGVQGHGQQIVDALNAEWPGLNVWLSPSDAPVWPGFGSLDVTIDSGKGGWQFRPDGVTPYAR